MTLLGDCDAKTDLDVRRPRRCYERGMRTEQLARDRRRIEERSCFGVAGPAVQRAAVRVADRRWLRAAVCSAGHSDRRQTAGRASHVYGPALERVELEWWILPGSGTDHDGETHG